MTDTVQSHTTRMGGRSILTLIVLVAVAVSLALVAFMRIGVRADPIGGLAPGNPAPPLQASGWVNGTPPTAESLAGKVVVVDAWATWCYPCRMAAPHLVEVSKKFSGRDVVFLGLTSEDEESLPEIHQFIDETGIPWVNGYGPDAVETLGKLEAYAIPAVWVIGRDGVIVWNRDSRESLEDAIEVALQAEASAS